MLKQFIKSTRQPVTYMAGIGATINVSSAEHVVGDLVRSVAKSATHGVGEDGDECLLQGVGGVALLPYTTPPRHYSKLAHVISVCPRYIVSMKIYVVKLGLA